MEFQSVVRRRRMVRSFLDRPLPPEVVERILDNARRGPSAGFTQGFEFLVLEGPEQTARFWDASFPGAEREAFPWPALFNAPLVVVPLAHKQAYFDRYAEPDKARVVRRTEADWPAPYWLIDTGFAALLILLSAVDAGLGSFFFSVRDDGRLRAAFRVPEAYDPIGAIAIGYPAPDTLSTSLRRGHRPAAAIVHRGQW